jgi:hypothetical protein
MQHVDKANHEYYTPVPCKVVDNLLVGAKLVLVLLLHIIEHVDRDQASQESNEQYYY